MLQKIITDYPGIVALEGRGKITQRDYQKELVPLIKAAGDKHQKVKMVFYLGPDFKRFTLGGAWEDLKLAGKYFKTFEKCAIVTDSKVIKSLVKAATPFIKVPINVYDNESLEGAIHWVGEKQTG